MDWLLDGREIKIQQMTIMNKLQLKNKYIPPQITSTVRTLEPVAAHLEAENVYQ